MKTGVVIDGMRYFYDLTRQKTRAFLLEGDKLITTSRLDGRPCEVRVEAVRDEYVMVELVRECPTNIYWKLTKKDFLSGVYLINEELTAVQERGG